MMPDANDLLKHISKGDNEAFKTLFDMFFPKVKVFLVKFLKDDKAAEDISQDILDLMSLWIVLWITLMPVSDLISDGLQVCYMTTAMQKVPDWKSRIETIGVVVMDGPVSAMCSGTAMQEALYVRIRG